jgi:hypothetical protein
MLTFASRLCSAGSNAAKITIANNIPINQSQEELGVLVNLEEVAFAVCIPFLKNLPIKV